MQNTVINSKGIRGTLFWSKFEWSCPEDTNLAYVVCHCSSVEAVSWSIYGKGTKDTEKSNHFKDTLAEALARQVTQDGKNCHRRLMQSDNTEPPS